MQPGIAGRLAPDYTFTHVLGADGLPAADLSIASLPGRWKILFGFQDACPGCHRHGFPSLAALVKQLRGRPEVSFLAVQTVFEEFEANRLDRLAPNQTAAALLIPFAHDDGAGKGSAFMQLYRCGGTPWFVVIEDGTVLANGFQLNASALISYIEEELAKPKPPPGTFSWPEVMRRTQVGNPAPARRDERTTEQWRQALTAEQFRITREHGTERAHSSEMCRLFTPGRYACICCGTELFDSTTKFDSGTGWPSFTQAAAPDVIGYHADDSYGMTRVEVRCNVCDAHLGHVFPDGPPPSGLRYCINALALQKQSEEAAG